MQQPQKSKKINTYLKLEPLLVPPSLADLRNVLSEANRTKGCTVELPWRAVSGSHQFSLTVRVDLGGAAPVWTLYGGPDQSLVIWNSVFQDLDLLCDVISLSVPPDGTKTELPPELKANDSEASDNVETAPTQKPNIIETPQSPMAPVNPGGPPVPVSYGYPPYMLPPNYPYPPGYVPNQYLPPYGYPGYPAYPPYAVPYPTSGNEAVPSVSQQVTIGPQHGGTYIGASTAELLQKRPNILLGHFLVESGLIPEPTLEAALLLQELVRAGALSTQKAALALKRAHLRGGKVEPEFEKTDKTKLSPDLQKFSTPLGQMLVEAGLISAVILKSALKLQEVVRSGKLNEEQACKALYQKHFGASELKPSRAVGEDDPQANKVIQLLLKADLISDIDLNIAAGIKRKHGGQTSKILIAAGKIDEKTFAAAWEIEGLMTARKLKLEQAIIALHYCHRTRSLVKDAWRELGWAAP